MLKIFLGLSIFIISLFADLKVIDNTQLLEMKEKGVEIVDIRRVDEWEKYGIIEGANILTFFDKNGKYDLTKWINDFSKILKDKETPVIIYCAHANRTKIVGEFLNKKLGYTNVYELEGGINYGWIDKGMKTIPYK